MNEVLQIEVLISPEVLEKYVLYYPDMESVADEIIRQVHESRSIITGKPFKLKYRKYRR